ncbi:tyrosine-type recombinase/integrase [Sphingobium sp. B2]|uniref:tyrosine-type recombinase/integrase n=1 Tax=Sphingobium sp. B2 TaxID=2583228 RepID=UPI0011A387D7|nr:integrase arm-type DNA-binding domain-containing protein [Sphingobium sp. B2]
MPLKELEVRYATKRSKDYKLADGQGLYLLVRPTGSRLWRMKYRFDGKEKLLSFGRYPEVSLAQARLRRAEAKLAIARGEDPEPRAAVPIVSFEVAARAWHANRVSALEPGHAARILSRLERDVFPALGQRDLKQISAADILDMLRAVEARGALDVSRRLRQHVSQVYLFAIPQGWASHDPAAGLATLLRPKPRVRHMPRVGARELPALVRAIHAYDGDENPRRRAVTRDALLFTLLTWARTNETRLATWEEFEGLDEPHHTGIAQLLSDKALREGPISAPNRPLRPVRADGAAVCQLV